jgi:hypothetical protein
MTERRPRGRHSRIDACHENRVNAQKRKNDRKVAIDVDIDVDDESHDS